ncbi:MAG TPA: UbiA-like polyprenyltransferase [Phycisphaerae bacterium]|nr:UbiA-like polyprenyltransferase [Phycisphaerae bacterium]
MNAATTSTLRTWAELVRFSHSVFALPFALIAVFLAARSLPDRLPSFAQLLLILTCMIAARSFAMTFNRIADRHIDARNPRTATRPLQTGRISLGQAWLFTILAALIFFAACAGFLVRDGNLWPLVLAAPTLLWLAGYSYTKRFTALAHFVLGAGIAFAPMAAWIAIHPPSLGWPAILLTGTVFFWIAGFDIIYACQDVDVDRRDGLFSIPARFGIGPALVLSRACHVAAVGLLIALGVVTGLGWIYWSGVIVTAILLAAEQAVVKPDDLSRVNLAFFTLNGCVSLLLALAAVTDTLLRR